MSSEQLCVLLVEDNRQEAELVHHMLSRARGACFSVRHVKRLGDALQQLHEGGRPHIVLLDLCLPDGSGIGMFEEVHRTAPEVPVIILTNIQDEEEASRAVREGAQDYLIKREVSATLLARSIRYAVERERAERALRESEERYALAVSGANDGLWDWRLEQETTYFSPRWKSMLGYGESEIGDRIDEWFERVHPDDVDALRAALAEHLEGRSPHFEQEHRIRTRAGNYLWVVSRGLAVYDAEGRAYRIAGSLTDIMARKRAEERLLHDAMHDSLTGLPNRSLLLDRLSVSLRQFRRSQKLFAVLYFDLDRFKNINDSLGHSVGDDLLIGVARRLENSLRPGDTLARLGGDEFGVLVNDIDGVTDATHVAERIHHLLGRAFRIREHEVYTSASIGLALATAAYGRPEEMLRDADLAMYRAKAAGHAQYEVFDVDMHERAVALLRLETELRRAVEHEEFLLRYQPIVSLQSGRILGFEALVRWNHPERGVLAPKQFVGIAEEMGLIVPIGWWVLRKACEQAAHWQRDFRNEPPLAISVNISGKLFLQSDMVRRLSAILRESGLPAASLRLEITESAIMDHSEAALARLSELRRLGVQLYIDDFGTGYSSLSYLQRFAYDTLKIDQSFVGSMIQTGDGRAIVETIITLGRTLGMNVIAEGVETADQYRELRRLACPQAQGYWFSRPVDQTGASALLAHPPQQPM